MTQRYSKILLRKLRNSISIEMLIADILKQPSKISEGYFRFLCPICSEFNTAINPETNLARCFRCGKNYNPIDIVMSAKMFSFTQSVDYLLGISNVK